MTAPEITFRFEAENEEALDDLVGVVAGELGETGKKLHEKYASEKAGTL